MQASSVSSGSASNSYAPSQAGGYSPLTSAPAYGSNLDQVSAVGNAAPTGYIQPVAPQTADGPAPQRPDNSMSWLLIAAIGTAGLGVIAGIVAMAMHYSSKSKKTTEKPQTLDLTPAKPMVQSPEQPENDEGKASKTPSESNTKSEIDQPMPESTKPSLPTQHAKTMLPAAALRTAAGMAGLAAAVTAVASKYKTGNWGEYFVKGYEYAGKGLLDSKVAIYNHLPTLGDYVPRANTNAEIIMTAVYGAANSRGNVNPHLYFAAIRLLAHNAPMLWGLAMNRGADDKSMTQDKGSSSEAPNVPKSHDSTAVRH